MQYPEQRWDSQLPPWFRGAPALVKDEHGKERCVACQLCEFICPPRAITIVPEEIPPSDPWAKVEKRPKEFEIDMIRCIYCGLCEEVCPEQAIFLKKEYSITGYTRKEMVNNKEKLLEMGGVMEGLVTFSRILDRSQLEFPTVRSSRFVVGFLCLSSLANAAGGKFANELCGRWTL